MLFFQKKKLNIGNRYLSYHYTILRYPTFGVNHYAPLSEIDYYG